MMTPDTFSALQAIDSPTIANAIEAFDVRPRTAGYVSHRTRYLFPELGVLLGYAVTATVDTTSPLEFKPPPDRWGLYEALEQAPKPAVVVLQAVGSDLEYSCVCGGGMATLMMRLGADGLVTNGGVRDLTDLQKVGFRCFSPGAVVSHGTIGIQDVNVPVTIDGVSIEPGDLLHGDENGLVVVPEIDGMALLAEAQRVLESESRLIEAIAAEDFTLSAYRKTRERHT